MARKTKKRELTPNQQAYQKELNRIRRLIRGAENRGYRFPDFEMPAMPQRVYKRDIESLKEINRYSIYRKAEFIDYETGEVLTGTQGRKLERERAARKAQETRKAKINRPTATQSPSGIVWGSVLDKGNEDIFANVVIKNWKQDLMRYNERARSILYEWMDRLVEKFGAYAVAKMLDEGARAGIRVDYKMMYDEERLHAYVAKMLNYLPEAGPIFKAQVAEAMGYDESIVEKYY